MLMIRAVPHLPSNLHLTPDRIAAVAFCMAAVTGASLYVYFNRKSDPEEIERLRRQFLAEQGRITDATLIDTSLNQRAGRRSVDEATEALPDFKEPPPSVLQYQYRVAGVQYESAQDVSGLTEYVLNFRIDLPIQIRYDPHNPETALLSPNPGAACASIQSASRSRSVVLSATVGGLRVSLKTAGRRGPTLYTPR